MFTRLASLVLLLALIGAYAAWVVRVPSAASERAPLSARSHPVRFEAEVRPFFAQYCYGCHGEKKKADLDLRQFATAASVVQGRQVFEKVLRNLRGHVMPPEQKPQPSEAQREAVTTWIQSLVFACDCSQPDPGRTTIRRLNRAEYNNTIRDLLAVDFRPAFEFPADDVGYGFDNIGDVLSLPPVLLEEYLAAAEKILTTALEPPKNQLAPSAAYRRIFIRQPTASTAQARVDCARQVIGNFARHAYRRPVTPAEVDRLMKFFDLAAQQGESFDQGIELALEAVLVSPHFLFRGELQPEPNNPQAVSLVDEFALASRLSYFLWSSMPDEELFRLAGQGRLRRELDPQVRRMLRDPKARALVDDFADQWLQIRNLDQVAPDKHEYPAFDESLRAAMRQETELFFSNLIREDRSILDLLQSDYSFLNERLARHYGIEHVEGSTFRRVSLSGTPRGGLLTQASILTITSNPTRTSPVKRGKWILDNILGTPPPPPPPNVPELKDSKTAKLAGTLRQRMEQHRADPMCASCHAQMDPIGFGFENFDGIGAWRDREGEFSIDATGKLANGQTFNGPAELRRILLTTRRDDFVRCLSAKMLTYALGRGLEHYDDCALHEITSRLARGQYRFSELILAIVHSPPFQLRRGDHQATNPRLATAP